MAQKKWIVLPGGRIKRWKKSQNKVWGNVPPRWFRNIFNRKERYKSRKAMIKGEAHRFSFVHPKSAGWYW